MQTLSKISALPETNPAFDWRLLFAEGMDEIRSRCGQLWTDHNTHDPGITILELACYALTELSHRCQFPLADLLSDGVANSSLANQFYTPRQVLPNRPLTEADYRKLLIDLPGVKNAWIQAAEVNYYADINKQKLLFSPPTDQQGIQTVNLQGLHKVLIEPESQTVLNAEQIKKQVFELLQANRNLAEDFVAVELVEDMYYSLCTELELTANANPHQISARIHFELDQYLSPVVQNYSLQQMLDRCYSVAEIFDGPALQHGFIDDQELANSALRRSIRLSDVIHIIMGIDGVVAVRDIVINPLQPGHLATGDAIASDNKWDIEIPLGKRARISAEQGRLVCYKRDYPYPVSLQDSRFQETLSALFAAQNQKLNVAQHDDLPLPNGRFLNVADYYSFQQHFPVLYGLSEQGPPPGSDDLRKAEVLQLKAYLLFFDQIMANMLAQLANSRELLARSSSNLHSYFAQPVSSFPDAHRIYSDDIDTQKLQALLESEHDAQVRRNRFLDHLLARVAENFQHYTEVLNTVEPLRLIAMKQQFLEDYPQLAAERMLAYNHQSKQASALWDSLNVSGLEHRLARLLDIPNYRRRNLSTVNHQIYPEIDTTPDDEYRFRIKHAQSGKILLSSSTNYPTQVAAIDEMNTSIQLAKHAQNYQRKLTQQGKHYFNIVDATQEVVARRIEYFDSEQEMLQAIEEVVQYMRLYQIDAGEGMFLIENVLLRPLQDDQPFMPICVDGNCQDCADLDPYSYQLHFILPAYAGRFTNMDFRLYVERTIREETPAHLMPRICWVSADDMQKVEAAWHDMVLLLAGVNTTSAQQKRQTLLGVLLNIKNVYPESPLRDCGCDPEKPPFILGRTILGQASNQQPT